VARIGEGRSVYRVLVGGPKGRDHWEDLDAGWRVTLSWTLWRQVSMGRPGSSWLRIGSGGGLM
jgi:hypothetical protein